MSRASDGSGTRTWIFFGHPEGGISQAVDDGHTPIGRSAIGGHLEIIQFLANYTENPNAPGEGGITPHSIGQRRWGHVKVVKFFG